MGAHCTLGGKCVLVEDSAIRLRLMPLLLSLVLPLMTVVEKGCRVIGLVVLMNPFLLGLCLYQSSRLGGTAHCFP